MDYVDLRECVNREIKAIIVPKLRTLNFKGSFPHFKRILESGRVDYLSFQFDRYCGAFTVECAVAYPYRGCQGNFHYWGEVTPDVVRKSNYGDTRNRLRIEPHPGKWFEFNDRNYQQTVSLALQLIEANIDYFDTQD